MEKFKNKYKIASARAKWWNYSDNGVYFITICTQNHRNYFGRVKRDKMCLSEIGRIAYDCWTQIPDHFPFVKLEKFVIMPNHVHGIIVIDKPDVVVETLHATSLRKLPLRSQRQQMAEISPKSNSVSTVIRSYKSVVSNQARKINNTFSWQSRFYDRIVRNNQEYRRIARYIINNPYNWANDRNFQDCY
ncbi:MAG: transposase [Candidatus Margulisbacteria bacterium]|nr:transposase [Candidatus Margulisiibacteriota bacterium]